MVYLGGRDARDLYREERSCEDRQGRCSAGLPGVRVCVLECVLTRSRLRPGSAAGLEKKRLGKCRGQAEDKGRGDSN